MLFARKNQYYVRTIHANFILAPPDGTHRSPCGAAADEVVSWLHLMVRTGDFAKQSSGSAALETEGFARAGRGLQAAVPRFNHRLKRWQSA